MVAAENFQRNWSNTFSCRHLHNELLAGLGDSTVFDVAAGRLAFSTDSYVVQPLFFPGGSIGDLAVNGTVNDLSMSGAQPRYLSAGFIIEEGFPDRPTQTNCR